MQTLYAAFCQDLICTLELGVSWEKKSVLTCSPTLDGG